MRISTDGDRLETIPIHLASEITAVQRLFWTMCFVMGGQVNSKLNLPPSLFGLLI